MDRLVKLAFCYLTAPGSAVQSCAQFTLGEFLITGFLRPISGFLPLSENVQTDRLDILNSTVSIPVFVGLAPDLQ